MWIIDLLPGNEPRLRIVLLESSYLICLRHFHRQLLFDGNVYERERTMNIVIICIIAKEVLKRVPRKSESTMIIDSLCSRDAEEEDVLSDRQIGDHVSEESATSV